jgi:hypothetical protein
MNIIIDPLGHAPNLKNIINNSIYFTRKKHNEYLEGGYYSSSELISYFNINLQNELLKLNNTNKFENFFFVICILSTEEKHQGTVYSTWINMYQKYYNYFINKIKGKIIIIDNHGYDYEPSVYLDKFNFKYDIILKRCCSYRNKHRYNNITKPYPFIMCTSNDPFYKLFNNSIIKNNILNKNNKIFWAGTSFKHDEEYDDNNVYSHANRTYILDSIQKSTPNIIDIKNVPYNKFHYTIASYKYALDLHGCSNHNKRFIEILNTNTLVLAENVDIVWPFEEGDKFSEECFFSTPNELIEIYNKFENNFELYKKCLQNQIYIVEKYFNNKWINNYINNIIY